MSRLPIGAHDYLTHLSSLKEALEHDELSPAQKNLAEQLLDQVALTKQRRLYIADMVAAGYTDEEIKLAFASPDSPMRVLIIAFNPNDTTKKFQSEIADARKEYTAGGDAARIKAHIRQRNFMLETVFASINQAGPSHHKSLLELANSLSQSIAELNGIQYTRAGRKRTKKVPSNEGGDTPEQPEEAADDPEQVNLDWGKEFVPDEAED